jgi:hypothetical protein
MALALYFKEHAGPPIFFDAQGWRKQDREQTNRGQRRKSAPHTVSIIDPVRALDSKAKLLPMQAII